MIKELSEADASGRIAEIYAEVRHLYATPYVSAIHRHLATRPGVLEWAWDSVAPVFRTGEAQEIGLRIARDVELSAIPVLPRAAMAVWGIGTREIGSIEAACDNFTRAAPVNLVFGSLVRGVMAGKGRGTETAPPPTGWTPPAPLPSPPPMVDAAAMAPDERAVLDLFRSGSGATAFVPGLYRMLARWPAFLAHLAVELGPRFAASETESAARGLLAGIDAEVEALLQRLPRSAQTTSAPDAAEVKHVNAMIDTYRKTSPELIVFGRLVREALPRADATPPQP